MKKRLFLTVVMALMMPFMMHAQNQVTLDTAVCGQYTWSVNGQTYTSSTQQAVFMNDTLYVLYLTVNPEYLTPVVTNVSGVCNYMFNGTLYSTSGTYTATLHTAVGNCDSLASVNLTVATTVSKDYVAEACASYTWCGNGQTYTSSTTIASYTKHDSVSVGNGYRACDSILSLDLTVHTPDQQSLDTVVTGCDRVQFKFLPYETAAASRYNTSVTITSDEKFPEGTSNWSAFHGRTVENCFDSVITAHITVNHTSRNVQNVTGCDRYVFEGSYVDENGDTVTYGNTYTSSRPNQAWYNGKNAEGCNDTIVRNVTIFKSPVVTIEGYMSLNPGESTVLFAVADQNNVTYTWRSANDQVVSTSDSLSTGVLQQNTDYSLVALKNNGSITCSDTNLITVTVNEGILDAEQNALNLYPNPTSDHINIACDEAIDYVVVYNMMGQVVKSSNESVINVNDLAKGTYAVRVLTRSGKVMVANVVIAR